MTITHDIKKYAGSIRKSLTNDRKKSFKKIFNLNLEKKNGPSNSILLDNTLFVRDEKGNVSILFKGKKIGNVNKNLEPELFKKKIINMLMSSRIILKKQSKNMKKLLLHLLNNDSVNPMNQKL